MSLERDDREIKRAAPVVKYEDVLAVRDIERVSNRAGGDSHGFEDEAHALQHVAVAVEDRPPALVPGERQTIHETLTCAAREVHRHAEPDLIELAALSEGALEQV